MCGYASVRVCVCGVRVCGYASVRVCVCGVRVCGYASVYVCVCVSVCMLVCANLI